jgi:hypothetical protein
MYVVPETAAPSRSISTPSNPNFFMILDKVEANLSAASSLSIVILPLAPPTEMITCWPLLFRSLISWMNCSYIYPPTAVARSESNSKVTSPGVAVFPVNATQIKS